MIESLQLTVRVGLSHFKLILNKFKTVKSIFLSIFYSESQISSSYLFICGDTRYRNK